MAYQSSLEDIEDELCNMYGGFTMSPSAYARSLEVEQQRSSSINSQDRPTAVVGGRGRGITNPQHMANVRLAASIKDLKAHPFPMGHLPTTDELLASPAENEITPMLRQLGLNSRAEEIGSRSTRMTPAVREEIRVDGSLPVILNGELFKNACVDEDEGVGEVEKFDPERPLPEQFSTIPELVEEVTTPAEVSKPNRSHAKKANTTDSSIDSGITSGSSGSSQAKKGKKKKWRKLQGEDLVPKAPERGRYEEVYNIGIHEGRAMRQIYSADGLVGWGGR